jgi:hypothetical protein
MSGKKNSGRDLVTYVFFFQAALPDGDEQLAKVDGEIL